jgi:hypothetical protein
MHPSQNEDFGRRNKRWIFEALFNGVSLDLGYEPWKRLEHLCSPNEDFGRRNKR